MVAGVSGDVGQVAFHLRIEGSGATALDGGHVLVGLGDRLRRDRHGLDGQGLAARRCVHAAGGLGLLTGSEQPDQAAAA